MKKAINGGKMSHKEWIGAVIQVPATNYEDLLLILQYKGYTVIKYTDMVTNPYSLKINKLSVVCLSDYDNWVEKLQKICGKRFRVSALPNLQEIFISIKTN